jgi:RNA polymerase sigma-70 factor (sigma-E family)
VSGAPGFEAFVRERWPSLVRSAYVIVLDRAAAEDLAQDALVVLHRRWGRLRDPLAAEAYARRVMVRRAGKLRRRRASSEHVTDRLPERPTADPADAAVLADAVEAALRSLPVAQRAVLVLRYLEGRSEAETALLLGVRPGTVKSRASRALGVLRAGGLLDDEPATTSTTEDR